MALRLADQKKRGDRSYSPRLSGRIGAICFWLALWAVIAWFVDNDILFAGPVVTIEAMVDLFADPSFWASVALSGGRIMGSAIAFSVLGLLLGLIAGRFKAIATLLELPIQIMKSAPVACVVVILLVVSGSVGAIIWIVAFVAFPPFYIASLDAMRDEPDDNERVLRSMGLSGAALFCACIWPRLLPLYRHAAKTAVGLAWRAGITGELLSIPFGSMGSQIYVAKLTLDTPALLAWTIVVMLLALVCELIIVKLLDASAALPKCALKLNKHDVMPARKVEQAEKAPVLLMADISKTFGDHRIFEAFDLELDENSRVCLMAPTGRGKTTLLRMALGYEDPTRGTIEHPSYCGVLLQDDTLIDCLTAWENIALVADKTRSQEDIRAQARALLPEDTLDKRAQELSGGTKRLTGIARALFSDGVCIVLDEPFTGLDAKARDRACTFIVQALGMRPLLVATHDIEDAGLLDASIIEF